MEPKSHLTNAPIREALIDLRCELPDDFSVRQFESLHGKIESEYPEKKTRRRIEGQIRIEDATIGTTTRDFGIDGYQFLTQDGLQIVQFRLDGFTFSRLSPYNTYEYLRDEARRLWKVYRKETTPTSVIRVALRYINELTFPLGDGGWEEWLTAPPATPEAVQTAPKQFLTRCMFEDPKTGTNWIINQASQEPDTPVRHTVLLDIDVFKLAAFDDDESIWETCEILREIKNRLFFGSITERAGELFA